MKQRCLDKNCDKYHRYGGRGIGICATWYGFDAFSLDSFFFAAAVGNAIKSRMIVSAAIIEAVRVLLDTDTIDQTPILKHIHLECELLIDQRTLLKIYMKQ